MVSSILVMLPASHNTSRIIPVSSKKKQILSQSSKFKQLCCRVKKLADTFLIQISQELLLLSNKKSLEKSLRSLKKGYFADCCICYFEIHDQDRVSECIATAVLRFNNHAAANQGYSKFDYCYHGLQPILCVCFGYYCRHAAYSFH